MHGLSIIDTRRFYHWIGITHVCRHWRIVALESPRLWQNILITTVQPKKIEVVVAFLLRSKRTPLHIKAVVVGQHSWKLLGALLMREVHRTETMELHVHPADAEAIASNFPSSAPVLQVLDVYADSKSFGASTVFPSRIVQCAMPALRELNIHDYYVDWSNMALPRSLRRLCVNSKSAQPVSPVVVLEFLKVHGSFLEDLEMAHVLPSSRSSGPHQTSRFTPVELPRLKILKVAESSFADIILPHSLHLSPSTPIWIELSQVDETDRSPLKRWIEARLPDSKSTTERIIKAFVLLPLGVELSTNGDCISGDVPGADIRLRLTVPFVLGLEGWLEVFHSQPSLRNVTTVIFTSFPWFCEDTGPDWRKLFGQMPNVSHLKFSGYSTNQRTLILALLHMEGRPNRKSKTHCSLLMSNVKRLTLQGISFRDSANSSDRLFLSDLIVALYFRERRGSRIELIVVDTCINVSAKNIAMLQNFVTVQWDGYVRWMNRGSRADFDDLAWESRAPQDVGDEEVAEEIETDFSSDEISTIEGTDSEDEALDETW